MDNGLLTQTPIRKEMEVVTFALNRDGTPRPDGFGAYFFKPFGIW